MRIYTDKKELISEIKRDLIEMGQTVESYSTQNKIVEGNKDYFTKEIINYAFSLSDIDNIEDIIHYDEFKLAEQKRIDEFFKNHDVKKFCEYANKNYGIILNSVDEIKEKRDVLLLEWLKEDFQERLQIDINPGKAWKIRPRVWLEYLNGVDGNEELGVVGNVRQFDYTYSERIHVDDLINQIRLHPESRQYVLNIRDRKDRFGVNGKKRIPCSLNYQILIRANGEVDDNFEEIKYVNIIYNMRSCDFLTHFPIDIIHAVNLMKYITAKVNELGNTNYKPGKLFYNCASLHLYHKDLVEQVF